MKIKQTIATIIATWFYVGKIPFMPGTWGSFATFPLFFAMHYLLSFTHSSSSFSMLFLGITALLFFIGQWATKVYLKETGKDDPGEVVIDEVVAQLLVFFAAFSLIAESFDIYSYLYNSQQFAGKEILVSDITNLFIKSSFAITYLVIALPIYLVCFILFRIFDIVKPWPIKWCDTHIKGAFGVMFDDLFAAVYAIIALFAIMMVIAY